MATAVDDFGEVYTAGGGGQQPGGGGAEYGGDDQDFFQGNAPGAAEVPSDATAAAEPEDDIYGGFTENGGQSREGDEGEGDDEEDLQIVLDQENVEKGYGGGRSSGGYSSKSFSGRSSTGNMSLSNNSSFSTITPGGRYSLGRTTTSGASGKSSQQQQKSIFEIDIDLLEDKPWRKPGVDLTDYFNYGFNEDSWRAYCEKQSQMRLEQSMQSKIKVYESARGEKEVSGKQELPPELQAMVDGDKRKRSSTSSRGGRTITPAQEDWPSRDRGFEHRRRPRDLDDAVIHINPGGAESEDAGIPAEGMEEFYIPTGGGYPPRGGFPPDFSRDDRRRDDDRKRDRDRRDDRRDRDRRSSSRSPPRREDRDKEKDRERRDRDKDKEKDRSERRERDKRKEDRGDREEREKDKDKDKDKDKEKERERDDRDDHKRKSSSSRDDEDRKRRR